jgi:hypothetical protein
MTIFQIAVIKLEIVKMQASFEKLIVILNYAL